MKPHSKKEVWKQLHKQIDKVCDPMGLDTGLQHALLSLKQAEEHSRVTPMTKRLSKDTCVLCRCEDCIEEGAPFWCITHDQNIAICQQLLKQHDKRTTHPKTGNKTQK